MPFKSAFTDISSSVSAFGTHGYTLDACLATSYFKAFARALPAVFDPPIEVPDKEDVYTPIIGKYSKQEEMNNNGVKRIALQ